MVDDRQNLCLLEQKILNAFAGGSLLLTSVTFDRGTTIVAANYFLCLLYPPATWKQ